jgi:hypothetical protein
MTGANPTTLVICGAALLTAVLGSIVALALHSTITGGEAITAIGGIVTLAGGIIAHALGVSAGTTAAVGGATAATQAAAQAAAPKP